jgi:HAD superfamily hydrolase (TIGR01450 family)
MDPIPEITIDQLIERYDVLLFDAYGVLVHSSGALPGAAALLRRLNHAGNRFHILTNDASKLPATAARCYQGYGLPIEPGQIISSGEMLEDYFGRNGLEGARCVVLGPEDSVRYVEQAGGKNVAPAEAFDVLVIADETGFPFLETLDTVFTSLCRLLDNGQKVHLVLPNPDLLYPKTESSFGFGAGSIAGMIEAALRVRYPHRNDLEFVRIGKPHHALFEEALSRTGTRSMVMVGDQLETDIKGARAFGLDAAWVATGETGAMLSAVPSHLRPTYRLRSL